MKILLIGAGRIAARHLDALSRIEGTSLAGVCDPVPENALRLARKTGPDVPVFERMEDALEQSRAHMVLLCAPRTVRLPVVEACVARRLPLFMEKPPCHNLETGRKIETLLHDAGLMHTVGFMHRWHGALEHARERFDFAAPGLIAFHYTAPMATRPNLEGYPAPYRVDRSGGLIGDQGIHYLDLARWISQSEIREARVLAANQLLPPSENVSSPDAATWMLRMENGTLVSHAHTWCADRWRCEATLTYPDGQARVDLFANRAEGIRAGESFSFQGQTGEFELQHRGFQLALREQNPARIRSPFSDALRSFQAAESLIHPETPT